MSWIIEAYYRDELNLTYDRSCPKCTTGQRLKAPHQLTSCKKHIWADKNWFFEWLKSSVRRG